MRAFDDTLEALDMDYLDLFLIHWPLPTVGDFVRDVAGDGADAARWPASARSGCPTSRSPICERLAAETETVPAVNQIEVHPYLTNEAVRAYNAEHGIATEAWSPIAQGEVLDDPVIVGIAERLGALRRR